MKTVIIGSGNVATHIALALAKAQHQVAQIYSRNIGNAQVLAETVNASAQCSDCTATDDLSLIMKDADVYLFSVKDDALPVLLKEMPAVNENAVCCHTAGSVTMEVFEGVAAHYGVLYPMQTFSKSRKVDFSVIPCFVEGNDDVSLNTIAELARSLSDSVHFLSSEKRKSLHLAAVFACNFTNHCYRLAERVLQEAGIDFSLYLPLIDETARKVHELSPSAAQTGPAIRYDETVINRHLAMLDDESMREIYRLMSQSIHRDPPQPSL